jgi:hypothetical protein
MVGFSYTSGSSVIIKFAILIVVIIEIATVSYIAECIEPFMKGILPEYWEYIQIVLLAGVLLITLYLLIKADPFIGTLIAYLHIHDELETPISFNEAKELTFLFVADKNGKWYPLYEARKYPKEKRKQFVFQAAARIKQERSLG